jgi:hypothetical protein
MEKSSLVDHVEREVTAEDGRRIVLCKKREK